MSAIARKKNLKTPSSSSLRRISRNDWICVGVLVAMTFAAYLPVLQCKFIWDDPEHVVNNANLRTPEGLARIWFRPSSLPQYYPLVHTVFWIEYHLWELNPIGYHVDNVILHATSVVLLWILLRRLRFPAAFFAAAIFAVHPVMVESVVWITERKNVLSLVFYLAAMLAYSREGVGFRISTAGKDGFEKPQTLSPKPYALAFLFFLAALFSKTVTCSFPAAVLLILWWKNGSLRWKRDILPLIPFFILGFSLAMVTAHLEKVHVGASGREWDFSPGDRILIAGRVAWFYFSKLVWPTNLMFIYPRWKINTHELWQWIFPVTAATVVVTLFVLRNKIGRGPLVAVLFFVGTLTPALGFFNVFPMRFSFVADHFQYHASIGIVVLLAATISLCFRNANPKIANLKFLFLIPLIVLTWRQIPEYKDSITLWQRTLEKNKTSWMVYTSVGNALVQNHRIDEADAYYEKALALSPDLEETQWNAGVREARRGDADAAEAHFKRALEINAQFSPSYESLGKLYASQRNDPQTAIKYYNTALAISPYFPDAHFGLARVLLQQGRVDEAIPHFREAAELSMTDADSRYELATILIAKRELPEAIFWLEESLSINPDNPQAWTNLGAAHLLSGHRNEAAAAFNRALQIDPRLAPARAGLERAKMLPPG